jgi:hypothetical protein
MNIDKHVIGIAGEFAVATELCRRNIHAQLTLGNRKRIDLLTLSHAGSFLKIEVKAKQGSQWPGVKGVSVADAFLVFVDFAGKGPTDRPDFYVLSPNDWRAFATRHIEEYLKKHPGRTAHLDKENCPVFPEEPSQGKPFRGCSVGVGDVGQHKEKWEKIMAACAQVTEVETIDPTDE